MQFVLALSQNRRRYTPRFRNLDGQDDDADFIRGYGFQTLTKRLGWSSRFNEKGFGADLKDSLRKPGPWLFGLAGYTECLPYESNRMYLSKRKVDRFGIPRVSFDFEWGDNDYKARVNAAKQADRLLKAAESALILRSHIWRLLRAQSITR